MKCSSILTHPTVIYEHPSEETTLAAYSAFLGAGRKFEDNLFAVSFEEHIRTMVTSCAWKIHIPAHTNSCWATPSHLKSLLTPTFRKRVNFIDKQNSNWKTVLNYFKPMIEDVPLDRSPGCQPFYGDPLLLLGRIASDFYNIVLATRHSCEVSLSPQRTLHMIRFLLSSHCIWALSAESRNRLTTIEGIFSLFTKKEEIPGFVCIPLKDYSFSERINEIMEDADLLQASELRRFFGLKSNVASIKRDMRIILKFISKKGWVKGALNVSSQLCLLPTETGALIDKLIGAIPTLGSDISAPVLLEPWHNARTTTHWVVIARKDIYDIPHGWCMEAMPIWGIEDNPPNKGKDVFVFINKCDANYVSSVHHNFDTSLKNLYSEK
ncbi:MAG: hypothetical protein WA081_17810 [Desulfosalsimonadaceae bacterium]